MKKSILAILLFVILFVLTLITAMVFSVQRPIRPTALYVFGDSLSDTGAVFRASGGLSPPSPYFQGRYSNGIVWVEYLAARLSIDRLSNFAWGGATTSSDRTSRVPGLQAQVQSWIQNESRPEANALYVLWAGANDYLQGATQTAAPVANITNAIALLTTAGARMILVANLPDLGQLPATRNSADSNRLRALTQTHNSGLRRSLKVLHQTYPDLQIITLDANALYQNAISNPAQFGFTNVTGSCLSGTRPCANPDQFLFWDGIHPTTKTHCILADAAVAALETQQLMHY